MSDGIPSDTADFGPPAAAAAASGPEGGNRSGDTADFGPPPAAMAAARAEPAIRAGDTGDFAPPPAAAASRALRMLPLPPKAAKPEEPPRPAWSRTCAVQDCAARPRVGHLCARHEDLRALGLLQLDPGSRRRVCLVLGCDGAPVAAAFCREHAATWHEGDLVLRRDGDRRPFVGYRQRARRALAPLALLAGIAVATVTAATLAHPTTPAWAAPAGARPGSGRGWYDPERLAALEARRLSDPGVGADRALREALESPSYGARRRAVAAVAGERSGSAAEALVDALEADDPGTRDGARRAIASIDEQGARGAFVDLLIQRISTAPTTERRFQLVASLGEIGGGAAVSHLAALADAQSSTDARLAAVIGLGRTGDPKAAAYLATHLADPDPALRAEACRGLGHAGDLGAVEGLIAALEDIEPRVRQAATASLRALSGQRIGEDPAVWRAWWRAGVADAFARLDERIAAFPGLSASSRAAALAQLEGIRDPRVVALARAEFRSDDSLVRKAAARALGALSARAALPDLILGLDDPSPSVAAAAHAALIAISGRNLPARRDAWIDGWASGSF